MSKIFVIYLNLYLLSECYSTTLESNKLSKTIVSCEDTAVDEGRHFGTSRDKNQYFPWLPHPLIFTTLMSVGNSKAIFSRRGSHYHTPRSPRKCKSTLFWGKNEVYTAGLPCVLRCLSGKLLAMYIFLFS